MRRRRASRSSMVAPATASLSRAILRGSHARGQGLRVCCRSRELSLSSRGANTANVGTISDLQHKGGIRGSMGTLGRCICFVLGIYPVASTGHSLIRHSYSCARDRLKVPWCFQHDPPSPHRHPQHAIPNHHPTHAILPDYLQRYGFRRLGDWIPLSLASRCQRHARCRAQTPRSQRHWLAVHFEAAIVAPLPRWYYHCQYWFARARRRMPRCPCSRSPIRY